MKTHAILIGVALAAIACEKPAPKEKTPEHLECLERAEAYLACKEKEAASAGPAEKQILRAVEANRRKANISADKCESVLGNVGADDSCAP